MKCAICSVQCAVYNVPCAMCSTAQGNAVIILAQVKQQIIHVMPPPPRPTGFHLTAITPVHYTALNSTIQHCTVAVFFITHFTLHCSQYTALYTELYSALHTAQYTEQFTVHCTVHNTLHCALHYVCILQSTVLDSV